MEIFIDGVPEDQEKILKNFLDKLGQKFGIEVKDNSDFEAIQNALMDFESIQHYQWISILNHFEIKSGEKVFHLFHTGFEYVTAVTSSPDGEIVKGLFTDIRLIGYCDMGMDTGHTLIRPRTEADFLTELLGTVEVKIPEFTDFSNDYFVVSDNRGKATIFLSRPLIDSMKGIHGLYIETLENVMVTFFDHALTDADGPILAGLLDKLAMQKNP